MKNTVLILFCIFPGMITLILIMTVYGRINRSMELKSNLSSAMEETVENRMTYQNYEIRNEKEFVADFVETLVYTTDARSEMQVDILQCDWEKGILSSNGIIFFEHPNGKVGSIKTDRTVIYSKRKEEVPLERYKVDFYIGENCYKSLEVCENSFILPPKQPEIVEKRFVRWIKSDGTEADFSRPVVENIIYYADMQ